MTDVDKAPSLEDQFGNTVKAFDQEVKDVLKKFDANDPGTVTKIVDGIRVVLQRARGQFVEQQELIKSTGAAHDKLLNRVHELTTVRGGEDWAKLIAQFSNYVANTRGSEIHPMLSAVMSEILKAQRHIVDQETKIEELQQRRQHEVRVMADEEPLNKRIERFKRGLQTMFNSMQSSKNNDMAVPSLGVTKAKNTLTQGCQLVQDLADMLRSRGGKLVELTENAIKETELLTATQMERDELKRLNEKLDIELKAAQASVDDAYNKFDAILSDSNAKDEELINLRTNYAECLSRLFKAKIMRPEELYSKGALFLPQVTFTPERDGFYEVNPKWHDKVVNDLELDLKDPGHRRTYERVLIASAARLHNNNHPVGNVGKQEITVVVAWDAYLSVDRKSPTFSTGKLPLLKPAAALETMTFSYQHYNGWENNDQVDESKDSDDVAFRKQFVPKVEGFMVGFYESLIKRLELSDIWALYVHVRKTWDFEDSDTLKPRIPMRQRFLDYLEGNEDACKRMFQNGMVFAGNYMIGSMIRGGYINPQDVSILAVEDVCMKALNEMLYLEMLHWVFVVNDRVVFDCPCPDDVNPAVTDLAEIKRHYARIWSLFDERFPYANLDFDNGPRGCTVKVVADDVAEPSVLAKHQVYIGHNLYTISKEFVIWFSKYKTKGKSGLDELYARNDFRTYLSEKLAKFIGIGITPVVVIDWDAAAITGDLNFICLPLDPYRDMILKQLDDNLHPMHDGVTL